MPRPFHPALAVLPPKHPTHCLAAVIHTVLQRHLFNSKESSSTISEEFQVALKKLYEGLTGKRYDPGQKLTKAEKAAQEVTPSTTSSTPSATPMDVEHKVPTTQEPSQGAIPRNRNSAQANNKSQSNNIQNFGFFFGSSKQQTKVATFNFFSKFLFSFVQVPECAHCIFLFSFVQVPKCAYLYISYLM